MKEFFLFIFLLFTIETANSQDLIFRANFDGTLTSSESEDPLSSKNLSFTEGILGQGILFPVSGALQYPILNNLDVKQGSMSLWVKPNWTPGTLLHRIMVVGNDPRNFELHIDEGSNLAFAVNTSQVEGKPIVVALQSVDNWSLGGWHHLTFNWDSTEIQIYVDGGRLAEAQIGFQIPEVVDIEFHVGSYLGGEGFDGIIDDLVIYNKPLTASAIKETYESALSTISKPGSLVITDAFERVVTDRSLELVDWEGFIRNPAFKYFIHPPASADFPLSVSLSANHGNTYFNLPSTVSMNSGPKKTIIFNSKEDIDSFYVSSYPDRDLSDDAFDLTFRYFHQDGIPRHQSIPFIIRDEDIPEELTYDVVVDFSEDTTSLIAQPDVQEIIEEAARDWVYFVDGSNIDEIDVGDARVWIGRTGNLLEDRPVTNKKKFKGLYMFVHGTNQPLGGGLDENGDPLCICSTGYSGDESFHTSEGIELLIRSIGGHELNIQGNFSTNGYNSFKGAEDWTYENSISGKQDLYELTKHEMGHIIYGSFSYPVHAEAVVRGYFFSPEISAYYPEGVVALLDGVPDHYDGVIDPISLGHAYGGNFRGMFLPDMREIFTKIDLLIMQAIGYPLRPIRAIAPLKASISPVIEGKLGDTLSAYVEFSGSLPYFNISVAEGTLPVGIKIDNFTGEIYGTPGEAGTFPITIKVEEYDAVGKSLEIETIVEIREVSTATSNGTVDSQVILFPNPTNDRLLVKIVGDLMGAAELEIYDLTGHCMLKRQISRSDEQLTLPLSHYASGIYFVVLRTSEGTVFTEVLIKS